MGRLSRLNQQLREDYRMKTVVTYIDTKSETLRTKEMHNVKNVGIHQSGVYMFTNGDNQPIFHIPVGLVVCIDWPEHDTALTIPQAQLGVTL